MKKFEPESAERLNEIEKMQEITTSLTLQIQERDQQIEKLKKSLKGYSYYYIDVTFDCMSLLKDLAFIPQARKPVTGERVEETHAKTNRKEESTTKSKGSNTFCKYSCRYFTSVRGE